eukprot:gene35503-47735_t
MQRKLVGHANFVRCNPKSDRFSMYRFHHVEYWCSDAISTAKSFIHGLGLNMVAKSDLTTGNKKYASYALQSKELLFIFTAPYSSHLIGEESSVEPHPDFQRTPLRLDEKKPHPDFQHDRVYKFIRDHGLAVRAVTIRVDDA